MASDLSAETPPLAIKRVTMDSSAGDATAITLPTWCRKVTLTMRQSDGTDDTAKLAVTGTDGAAIGNDHFPIQSGGAFEWHISPGRSARRESEIIYVAAGTASAQCHIMMEG